LRGGHRETRCLRSRQVACVANKLLATGAKKSAIDAPLTMVRALLIGFSRHDAAEEI